MPIYDMRCPEGDGYYHDMLCSITERHQQPCPACGVPLEIVPPPIMTVGPMPSTSTYKFDQIGRHFTSNEELRQYKRENPNVRFQNKHEIRRHKDQVRAKCEATAQRQGYQDLEEKRGRLKKDALRAS